MSAATAKILLSGIALEGAGAGAIAAGATSSSAIGGTIATILTRAVAIGTLLSLKDDAPPSRYYVYVIQGSNTTELAKIGITRQTDPANRPQSQITGLNARYSDFGPHSWTHIQGPVSQAQALLYEKYYVWEYNQSRGKMPYAQSYPYADALTRYLQKNVFK